MKVHNLIGCVAILHNGDKGLILPTVEPSILSVVGRELLRQIYVDCHNGRFEFNTENSNYNIDYVYKLPILHNDTTNQTILSWIDDCPNNAQLIYERHNIKIKMTKEEIEEKLGYKIEIVDKKS